MRNPFGRRMSSAKSDSAQRYFVYPHKYNSYSLDRLFSYQCLTRLIGLIDRRKPRSIDRASRKNSRGARDRDRGKRKLEPLRGSRIYKIVEALDRSWAFNGFEALFFGRP